MQMQLASSLLQPLLGDHRWKLRIALRQGYFERHSINIVMLFHYAKRPLDLPVWPRQDERLIKIPKMCCDIVARW
jgi:hypothetical protein